MTTSKARVSLTAAAVGDKDLQKAMAGVDKAKVNHANAKKISERRQKLAQTNITSVESAETAQAVEDAAAAEVNVSSSDVLVAKAAIGDAKAQRQQEAATLDFHTLSAPYDAMVTARLKEVGSALAAGEPVFR
jgi:HlyD family secretion protein